jgi:hypothetical protein
LANLRWIFNPSKCNFEKRKKQLYLGALHFSAKWVGFSDQYSMVSFRYDLDDRIGYR